MPRTTAVSIDQIAASFRETRFLLGLKQRCCSVSAVLT